MDNGLDLTNRVAVVTGSTRGIGWSIADTLAAHGASVVVNGARDAEQVERCAAQLEAAHGAPSLGVLANAGDAKEVAALYQTVFKRFKRLDVLVNCAGIMRGALIGMISQDLVEETLRINLAGTIHHLQAATKLMLRGGSGSVINITSVLGLEGTEGQSVYAASKAGVIGFTRAAAKELAPKGVRVNAVAPGFIETELTDALPAAKREEFASRIRLGRTGQPADVANAVLYLASDLASFVTGQVLAVEGSMAL